MTIDLFKKPTQYTVAIMQPNKTIWVEEAVEDMSWSGSIDTAARTLQLTCRNINKKADFSIGDLIVLYDADKNPATEIMRGTIVKREKAGGSGVIKYTAYDNRWWLVKNKHDRKYENMTATAIMADCCKTFGIPYGSLTDTGVKFDVLHMVKKSLWDTIVISLTETRKRNGRKFTTKMVGGKITLVEKVTQTHKWVIEQGVNLIASSYSESIESTYTQVKVIGKDKNKNEISAVTKDSDAISKYGCMQEIVEQSEETTQDTLNTIAAQKLKELAQMERSGTVTTIGINGVEAGNAVYVVDKETGLIGGFYVQADEHTVRDRHHTMKLTLSWTDELPTIDYEPPQEEK